MKSKSNALLLLGIVVWMIGCSSSVRANTSYSADYYLTTPDAFQGQMVTLDVVNLKPVNFKSPIPELAFFHMMTWDRSKGIPGGEIMLVAPATDARNLMKKYGGKMPRPGMGPPDVEKLKGVFTLSPGGPRRGEKPGDESSGNKQGQAGNDAASKSTGIEKTGGEPGDDSKGQRPGNWHGPMHPQIWMIDYEGKSREIIEAHKEEMKNLKGEQDEPPSDTEKGKP
ncbi:MAG: hypothetical protein PHD76_03180 [Methylacidiphilales bacterium]|nr:hypothetical protein [Candidatus Methylacidiphilales bacterium]